MITALKNRLRRLILDPREQELLAHGRVLTAEQTTLLDADRQTVLRAMLAPEHWQLLRALETALRQQDAPKITKAEADGMGQFFASPLGLKIDATMNNWLVQQAQNACSAPSAEIVAHAKFAWGCRAGWEMAKTISRLAAADSSAEDGPTTGGSSLDQLNP